MRKRILMLSGLLFLTAGSLFAYNPFEDLATGNYVGYYQSYNMTITIGEDDGVFEGTVTRKGLDYPFTARLKSGSLKGTFGDTKKYPLTLKLDKDKLTFQSGTAKDTLTKQTSGDRSFADQFSSNKVLVKLESDGGNSFSGILKINGKIFPVKGKASGPFFYGKFKSGDTKYPFTLMWNGEKVNFNSSGFKDTLESKNIEDEKTAKLKAEEEARLAKARAITEARLAKARAITEARKNVVKYFSSLTDNGSSYYRNNIGMSFAYVSSGSFEMGSNSGESDEKPVHKVTLTNPYLIGKYEVTQREYEKVMGNNPSYFKGSNNPVEQVSWNDAVEFCRKLTEREHSSGNLKNGYAYRLPTEAQWEYAARGGSKSKGYTYSGSNSINSVAWNGNNSGDKTHPVGQKSSNELGLYDMSGNVWEWCSDWYGSYPSGSIVDPKGPSSVSYRVNRGGSYYSRASYWRVAYRNNFSPGHTGINLGFRVVLASE